MEKLILFSFMVLTMMSCKTSSVTSTKIDSKSQVAIKGNWTITTVNYPSSDFIKVTSFGLADSKCFEGSTWKFVANNNSGEMALNKSDCASFSSPIKWFINKEGQFILKVLSAGEKAKKVRDGYVLGVNLQDENNFQLIDKINVGNKPTDVVYQFQKVN